MEASPKKEANQKTGEQKREQLNRIKGRLLDMQRHLLELRRGLVVGPVPHGGK